MKTQSRERTNLDSELVSKLVNAEDLENSLSAGSKKRLRQYRKNVMQSSGKENVLFDDKVLAVIEKYAYDRREIRKQVEYLNNLKDEEGNKFSRNLKEYCKISKAVKGFASPDHPSFRWNRNYQSALKWLLEQFQFCNLKPLKYECDDDIRNALPKEGTHSGFYWIETGRKKKGLNMEGIYSAYSQVLNQGMINGSLNRPVLIGFRTQASGEYDDEGNQTHTCKHKTRMVQMFDLLSIVLELSFSVPFQEVIGNKDFYAGGKNDNAISSILTRHRINYTQYFSIDYSNFDATISKWLIEDVFRVIKSSFILTDEQSFQFDIMVHDFIHKRIVLGEGDLNSDRAVPSGSMWTQIVDSLVNLLAIKTYFNAINEKAEMMTMGDDNIIFTSAATSIQIISSYIRKNFGLDIKIDDKSAMGSTSNHNGVKFLSRFWRWDGQYRHPNLLLSRLLFPERFRPYNDEVTPELVVYAFILTYNIGMSELMNCQRFISDVGFLTRGELYSKVDSRYLPGAFAYIREYTLGVRRKTKT